MVTIPTAMGPTSEMLFTELRQLTITSDDQIGEVNDLLAQGWRLIDVGYRAEATVYVVGRFEERTRHRAGFLAAE